MGQWVADVTNPPPRPWHGAALQMHHDSPGLVPARIALLLELEGFHEITGQQVLNLLEPPAPQAKRPPAGAAAACPWRITAELSGGRYQLSNDERSTLVKRDELLVHGVTLTEKSARLRMR